ncbi:hypothetical protein LEN26_020575 [Aphanomyces euteiches]|nr:hypothetical protein LEN26_020575 [Aphanomyces euteiches]KAH9113646.1 hypothetical protein AeMF1_012209 [Aphanomyces euteiches]KAH9194407.1 hypothetical protein AeNC1_003637 [Aphanomyces euteiches]
MEEGQTAEAGFKPKLIERILRNVWENTDQEANAMYETKEDDDDEALRGTDVREITKIQPDALNMTAEFMRLFVLEALRRAQDEAMIEESTQVEPRHIEQILAVLLLDF